MSGESGRKHLTYVCVQQERAVGLSSVATQLLLDRIKVEPDWNADRVTIGPSTHGAGSTRPGLAASGSASKA